MPYSPQNFQVLTPDQANPMGYGMRQAIENKLKLQQARGLAAQSAEKEATNQYAGEKAQSDIRSTNAVSAKNELHYRYPGLDGTDIQKALAMRTIERDRAKQVHQRIKDEHPDLSDQEIAKTAKKIAKKITKEEIDSANKVSLGPKSMQDAVQGAFMGQPEQQGLQQEQNPQQMQEAMMQQMQEQMPQQQQEQQEQQQQSPPMNEAIQNSMQEDQPQQQQPQQQKDPEDDSIEHMSKEKIYNEEMKSLFNEKKAKAKYWAEGSGRANSATKNRREADKAIMEGNPWLTDEELPEARDAYYNERKTMNNGKALAPESGLIESTLLRVYMDAAPKSLQLQYHQMENINNELSAFDIEAVAKYAGPKGRAKLNAWKAKMAINPNDPSIPEEVRRALSAKDVSVLNMDSLRKALGTSVVASYVFKTLQGLADPNDAIWKDEKQVKKTARDIGAVLERGQALLRYQIRHGVTANLPDRLKMPKNTRDLDKLLGRKYLGSDKGSDEGGDKGGKIITLKGKKYRVVDGGYEPL